MVRISTVLKFLTYSIALLGYAPLSPYLEIVPQLIFPVSLIGGVYCRQKREPAVRPDCNRRFNLFFYIIM